MAWLYLLWLAGPVPYRLDIEIGSLWGSHSDGRHIQDIFGYFIARLNEMSGQHCSPLFAHEKLCSSDSQIARWDIDSVFF